MLEEGTWNRTEDLFQRIPLPYSSISLILCLIIYLGFVLFDAMTAQMLRFREVNNSQDLFFQLSIIIACIIIPFQIYIGLQLSDIIKKINSCINLSFGKPKRNFYQYLVMVFVMLPFYLIDWIPLKPHFWKQIVQLYLPIYNLPEYHNIWGLAYDIYINVLGFASVLLLSLILFSIIKIMNYLRNSSNPDIKFLSKSNIFNICTNLKSIKDQIITVSFYYSILLPLMGLSYYNPYKTFSIELILLLFYYLVGISFFFNILNVIRRIRKDRVRYELDSINEINHEQMQKIRDTVSKKSDFDKTEEISHRSNIISAFQEQKKQLEEIETNDSKTNIKTFFIDILSPLLFGYLKVNPEALDKAIEITKMATDYIIKYISKNL